MVNKLPPEILVHIFWLLQEKTYWFELGEDEQDSDVPWIQITWVCQRWRSVALSAPALWTTISASYRCPAGRAPYGATWVSAFLERSAKMLLEVGIEILHADDFVRRDTLALLYLNGTRIRTLVLDTQGDCGVPCRLESLTNSIENMAFLENFQLIQEHPPAEGNEPWIVRLHVLPRLRSVNMSATHFPWGWRFGSMSLRALTLTATYRRPSINHFIGFLQRCPALESLSLDDCLPIAPERTVATWCALAIACLPKLAELYVWDTLEEVRFICDSIEVPSTCFINLRANADGLLDDDPGSHPIRLFIPLPCGFYSLYHSARSLMFSEAPYPFLSLSAKDSDPGILNDAWGIPKAAGRMLMSLGDLDGRTLWPPEPELWTKLWESFSPAPLSFLALRSRTFLDISEDMWHTCFAQLPSLQTIVLYGRENPSTLENAARIPENERQGVDFLNSFLHALSPRRNQDGEAGQRCATLRRIELHNLPLFDSSAACAVGCALRRRAERGLRVQEVCFNNCYFYEDVGVDIDVFKRRFEESTIISIA